MPSSRCPECHHEVSFFDVEEVGCCPRCGFRFLENQKSVITSSGSVPRSADLPRGSVPLWFGHLVGPAVVTLVTAWAAGKFNIELGFFCGVVALLLASILLSVRSRESGNRIGFFLLVLLLGIFTNGALVFAGCTVAVLGFR